MNIKNSKGFTLVEMLVVIAIISVLAAALFPAISNALSTASATALKQKGRGIWVAITSANMEREPLNEGTLWPQELETSDGISSSKDYFNYLLSDGDDTGTPTEDTSLRVVADLTPDTLIASGIKAGVVGTALKDENIAWGVVDVGDGTPAEIPFLITKNYDSTEKLHQVTDDKDTTRLDLGDDTSKKPFGNSRAVWVSRGGGTFDARKKYFTMKLVMGLGESTEEYDYWTTEQ